MKIIVLDHVIKCLQNKGGISRVWSQISERINSSNKININNDITNKKSIFVLFIRYFPSFLYRAKSHHTFLSSYYRVSLNPCAYNVLIVHDLIYELFSRTSLGTILHLLQRRFAFWWSDKIVCISNNTRNDLLNFYKFIDPNKVVVIHNGIDDVFFDDTPPVKLDLPFDSYFMFVGSRGYCKNFIHIIEILRRFKNLNCIIVSSPLSHSELNEYKDVIDRLFVISNINDMELKYLYKKCDYVVFPSLYEGFGLPILEAFAMGKNVILPRAHCFPEVSGNLGVFYDIVDINSLYEAVIFAESQKNAYNQHLKSYSKNFVWDNIIEQYQRELCND